MNIGVCVVLTFFRKAVLYETSCRNPFKSSTFFASKSTKIRVLEATIFAYILKLFFGCYASSFGPLLAHLWLPFGVFRLPFASFSFLLASFWLPCGGLQLTFCSLSVPFRSNLLPEAPFWLVLGSSWCISRNIFAQLGFKW